MRIDRCILDIHYQSVLCCIEMPICDLYITTQRPYSPDNRHNPITNGLLHVAPDAITTETRKQAIALGRRNLTGIYCFARFD